MGKILPVNQKRAKKQPENKKRQPLKVVYITNPIKFNASASEFRALVQELTGQDADTTGSARIFSADGGGEAARVAAENNDHALEEGVTKMDSLITNGEVEQEGSDPSATGSYDDDSLSPQMIENLQAFMGWSLVDVFKSLNAM